MEAWRKIGGKIFCFTLPLTFSKDPFIGCLHPFLSIFVNGVSLELLSTEVCVCVSPPKLGTKSLFR
jgi:hypothetical protein